jgi:hypothetical protein
MVDLQSPDMRMCANIWDGCDCKYGSVRTATVGLAISRWNSEGDLTVFSWRQRGCYLENIWVGAIDYCMSDTEGQ